MAFRPGPAPGLLVHGHAEDALEELAAGRLRRAPAGPIRLAYLDPPFEPTDAFPTVDATEAERRWEEMIRRCLAAVARVVDGNGTVCIHIDRSHRDLCAALLRDAFGADPRITLWERDRDGEPDSLLLVGRSAWSGDVPSVWTGHDCGFREDALREVTELAPHAPFPHPKPSRLLRRLVELTTTPGDVVLDAFAGSGTCAAAAIDVGRAWISIDRDRSVLERLAVPRIARAAERRRARPPVAVRRRGFDYLVVGAGFAGSVLAERLARGAGKRVLVVDRRPQIGGNAYDDHDAAGILVHRYGPHVFHTNARHVFEYLSRFTEWRRYEHRVLASVDGCLVPVPINLDTVNALYGLRLDAGEVAEFFRRAREPVAHPRTAEDVVVGAVGRGLYEKLFRGYTRKQWGVDPSELDATVTARIPVRTDRDDRYFADAYQAMPLHGYTRMFERMLDHRNIRLMLRTDHREVARTVPFEQLIYTGPIDEFFGHRFGRLPYRSLELRFETRDVVLHQPAAVINHPNEHAYTRVTEFKYLTGQVHPRTTLGYEYPRNDGDPYYPVPTRDSARLYRRYRALARTTPGVHFVGRLGTYRYYNMDQVVAQALAVYERLEGRARRPRECRRVKRLGRCPPLQPRSDRRDCHHERGGNDG